MTGQTQEPKIHRDPVGLAPLPQRAVYALRAMAVLANLAPGDSLRAAELAVRATIPPAFVSKIMRRLVEGGLVDSRRGHGGGFRLALAPGRIPFTAILAAVDCELDADQCGFGFRRCDARNPCALHDAWSRLKAALTAWADGTMLSETRT